MGSIYIDARGYRVSYGLVGDSRWTYSMVNKTPKCGCASSYKVFIMQGQVLAAILWKLGIRVEEE